MSDPTTPAAAEPHAAVIELVERHFDDEKRPLTGTDSLIIPNHMRIDGVAVYATYDDPAIVHEIRLDGSRLAPPFMVTVSLLARAIGVGGKPSVVKGAFGGAESMSAVMVEIPDVDVMYPGSRVDRPYVLLNGQPVYVHGDIVIGELSAATRSDAVRMARVTLTLPCRRLVVDDEPCERRTTAS